MQEVFDWFMVMANNKSVTLLIFFITFVGILIYVYGSKKRSKRLETYKNIPFMDEDGQSIAPKSKDSVETQKNTKGEK